MGAAVSSNGCGFCRPKEKVFSPIITAFCMPDPRRLEVPVSIVAFYYPDKMTAWDTQCAAGFLGNFWCMGENAIHLDGHYFTNAEAAFQATKFWNKVDQFRDLNGTKAFQLKCSLQGQEDITYNGRGSNWKAMIDVLAAKFQPNSDLAEGLLDTGDVFLLEHNERQGRDTVWSDDMDGEGKNWLGLQLMVLRDELRGTTGAAASWTHFVTTRCELNRATGSMRQAKLWQDAVRAAAKHVKTKCP